MTSKVTRGFLVGAVAGLGAALLAEAGRPLGGTTQVLDWDEIRELATRRLREEPLPAERLEDLGRDLERLAGEMRGPLLDAVGGLPPGVELPPFQALDRHGWLELNVGIMAQVMEPLMETTRMRRTRLTELGRAGVDRYVAFLLDFLGRRVLGQFDPQLAAAPSPLASLQEAEGSRHALYLVEPNVESWESSAHVNGEDLRRWLILHEMAHAWQFAAHPWLREHLNGLLSRLIREVAARGQAGSADRLLRMTVGAPEQWRVVRELQATMTLVEGYGNLLMQLVGRRVLPSYDELEDAYRHRSSQRGAVELLVWRLTGLELKLRQYRVGEAFAQHIHDVYGMATLNRAWDGPDNLPRPGELRDPERWYRRVIGTGPLRTLPSEA
ncbi:MAG: zinc-dependent metalloprotease [Candidatus Dormibacteraeota bacterium]|nr:zinc-dependent metalloprotease [Candidatus Dormibacteraeota bacterium]MBO0703889.1 zinc-dependent metalloprotease [Candidatus Dormibacteraeota bacterium]MBO0760102.1 zinc-dependent metalloprotease [Candidatus Dormibacteraeota bacterium]